ncbi:hypothetical protein CWB58_09845 [Pseudoalteromonas sp. S201]|uniref:hypothetical protein n=1 Tax=Pseudoalteromonas sp. S201 TaxID=579519 RepID=UPI00110CC3A0|nr:hypothetical protein [Pseudoalteromonas sp. S201]TMS93319.1 hypothetical protein CWB58_09845 [Pseudoalteromonas sp. S201]
MSKFSLDKFIKKKEEVDIPSFARVNESITAIYLEVLKRVAELEEKVETIPATEIKKLGIKEKKIVPAQITDSLNMERSSLRRDRITSKLLDFIDSENRRIATLWTNKSKSDGAGKRLSKEEQEKVIEKQATEIRELKQKLFHDYCDKAIAQEVLHSQKALAEQLRDLKLDYKAEQERCANLEMKVKELIREINTIGSRQNNVRP